MLYLLLLLVSLSLSVEPFVYSCEEVLFQLMNSSFEQHATYAYVFTQHDYTNWTQIENLYLVNGDNKYSFADIAYNGRQTGEGPWTVVGYDSHRRYRLCLEQFTLILKSDELPVAQFSEDDVFNITITRYTSGSSVFVSPLNGMWLTKNVMSGEGNVTVYTGAGIGEEEERFMLQSWPCNSTPDWIYSFDNAITIEFDSRCFYRLSCSTNVHSTTINVYRFDRIVILSSGRSDNAQNRQNLDIRAYIQLENRKDTGFVDVEMQLNFDTENTGSLDIQKHFGAQRVEQYNNESQIVPQFTTGYFEVRWNPKQLRANNISTNQDDVYVDIQISHRPTGCPDRFTLLISDDLQVWCYIIIWPLPPKAGFNFSESSVQCASMGATLPILTSQDIDWRVSDFVGLHFAWSNYWLGVECDTESNTWMWQDGQPVDFNEFTDETGEAYQWRIDPPVAEYETDHTQKYMASDSCSGSGTFGFEYGQENWRQFPPEELFDFIVCAKRPEHLTSTESYTSSPEPWATTENIDSTEPDIAVTDSSKQASTSTSAPSISSAKTTATPTTTTILPTTSTHSNSTPGLPLWAIVIIAVFFCAVLIVGFLLARRRISSLRAKVTEEKIENAKKSIDYKQQKRYYGHPGTNNEWEIERTYVGIEYLNKLGEGAFGSVFMGRVQAKNIPSLMGRSIFELSVLINEHNAVAVKMLHEDADSQKERQFRAEIDLMQRIGFHERLVNMLACVTISDPILLICEYCANGDLLDFLRKKRKYMLENPDETDVGKVITSEKQLMFAIQAAYGLEYLSTRGFVHRDIAARNILLDGQESCKIGDFGLARELSDDSEHYQAQGGKLPLKWMPPEAIANYSFSTASDVWSFGVLLYEIVTLGATPYAGWLIGELLNRLRQGDRMERPDNCSDKLYELMRACWSEQPSERPIFTELRKHLGDLLEEVNEDDYYLKLNANANYYVLESNASD